MFDYHGYTETLLITEGLILPCGVLLINIALQIFADGSAPDGQREPTARPEYQGRRRAE